MARITKADASDIANKIVKKIDEQVNKEREELKVYITDIYEATIPKEVTRMWNRGKKWMHSTSTVTVTGIGITSTWERTNIKASPSDNDYSTTLALTDNQAIEYTKRKDRLDGLVEKRKNTKIEIENLLIALSTWKRALQELPEIKDYIPDTEKREVMVIPKVTKDKIRCLINVKDTKCIETI